jgi:hypothetical protein
MPTEDVEARHLRQFNEFYGNGRQIRAAEKLKIYIYIAEYGRLPPGNKIRR